MFQNLQKHTRKDRSFCLLSTRNLSKLTNNNKQINKNSISIWDVFWTRMQWFVRGDWHFRSAFQAFGQAGWVPETDNSAICENRIPSKNYAILFYGRTLIAELMLLCLPELNTRLLKMLMPCKERSVCSMHPIHPCDDAINKGAQRTPSLQPWYWRYLCSTSNTK